MHKVGIRIFNWGTPKQWLSNSTLTIWHKNISHIQVNMMISQARRTANYGIMLDESTRGETKQFIICLMFWDLDKEMPIAQVPYLKKIMRCNSETVAKTVIQMLEASQLNLQNCSVWLTDNTAYLSGKDKGAIALFNKWTNSSTIRIGCGLHILHIILTNFEQEAFGKLSSTIGFQKTKHPFMLLTLA
ncbi:hypothetical protein C2G38_2192111 [Gigaspora rosea]|uniref:DUF659 domain-containing protein n=1 Tax=Gigaspora rosea TaxID=44941 RepID=A0A397V1V1_9GLOM|nr:hypothetical protein C2G38_2192111 [Gigaspora rosea]